MSGLASDEVAEDYKNSLEDLTTNDKFQISNLTVIAKENTEHAMAISRVLENHIRTTPPSQKLPALYVVDSVVKNVGTPYTLFLGRNLYQTFMNAYTLVDSQTRKKLDEMLKTWKEPVPGSLDPRPVFPPEITRSIENALIKARTAALQQQQARSQQDPLNRNRGTTPPSWRSTPTPTQAAGRYPPYVNAQNTATNGQHYAAEAYSQYPHQQPYGHPYQSPPQPPQGPVDLGALQRDIDNLIASARVDFASNPLDPTIQQRLKALLDLQSILQRQKLPEDQLKLIRDQVSQLSAAPPPQRPASTIPPPSIPATAQTMLNSPAQVQTSQPNLQALLNPNTLAELIKATASSQTLTPTPPALQQVTQPPHAPLSAPASTATLPASENSLIASLRARGLLPPVTSTPIIPTPPNIPFILPGQAGFPAPNPQMQPAQSATVKINVQMTSASIRLPRPDLITHLYEKKPNRCGTCGRRFPANEEGREKKARHLDWHFKTNQRMNDASKRGQNRSWYLDERDWIKSREYVDDVGPTDGGTGPADKPGSESGSPKKSSQQRWIRAPNDATLRNAPCPICQEQFESTWSEEAQDWIWQDATKVGNRVYHASCYSEVAGTKDGRIPGSGTPSHRTGTPDSVLGKRKAEEPETIEPNVRIKTEPVS
ncbi:hypothetical protein VTO42DRAFT_8350 [Malbranchea cinnamomea]